VQMSLTSPDAPACFYSIRNTACTTTSKHCYCLCAHPSWEGFQGCRLREALPTQAVEVCNTVRTCLRITEDIAEALHNAGSSRAGSCLRGAQQGATPSHAPRILTANRRLFTQSAACSPQTPPPRAQRLQQSLTEAQGAPRGIGSRHRAGSRRSGEQRRTDQKRSRSWPR